ncbi:MAG: hypothetical protein K2Y40_07395 [Reyranella sp.]|nr:hypothetical protein [Reyranella sp.]
MSTKRAFSNRSRLVACLLALLSAWVAIPTTLRAQGYIAPELVELSRALKGDPDLVYEYVYNNVATVPRYGSIKGPLGAFVDRQGTAFDQAELMVTLLRQAGVSANFVTGEIELTAAQLTAWLGVDNYYYSVAGALWFGGFPYSDTTVGNTVISVRLGWAWVEVNIGGTNYVFDPATKNITRTAGMGRTAISNAAGYDRTTFLANAAAVTTTSPWALTSLNRNKVRSDLTAYSSQLTQYIRSNNPAAATADIIGGASIVPLGLGTQQRIASLPNQVGTPTVSASIGSQFRAKITLQLGSNASNGVFTQLTSEIVFTTADVYGRSLWVSFSSGAIASLMLDDAAQLTASGTVPSGRRLTVRISLSYPSAPGTMNPAVSNNDDTRLVPGADKVFGLATSWGPVGRGLVDRHQRLLRDAIAANPGNPTAPAVLAHSFLVICYTYQAQVSQAFTLIGQMGGVLPFLYHQAGTVGIGTFGNVTGPYISMWIVSIWASQQSARPDTPFANPLETTAFATLAMAASVFESAVIEQTQPDSVAVSTVKLIDTAVQQGIRIFDINNNTNPGNNSSYYSSTIRPILQSTWAAGDLSAVGTNVAAGERVITAQSGAINVSQYYGAGWFRIIQSVDSIGGSISGNLRGGSPGVDIPDLDIWTNTAFSVQPWALDPWSTVIGSSEGNGGALWGFVSSGFDPTNLVTGDYYLTSTDLSVGSQPLPYGLSFSRYYDSGTRLQDGPLGLGWRHSFAITAKPDSDPFGALAESSPIAGIGAIIAILVTFDIFDMNIVSGRPLDRIVIGSVTNRWMADQTTTNVAAITQSGLVEHFTRLPDGSYNPPPGSAATLSLAGGAYTYVAKDRTTLTFNTDGNLVSWISPAGAAMTLNYTGSPQVLSSVTNNLGRSLNLFYTASRVSQVSDDTGRSISFTYDGAGNLTSFVDPLGQTTSHAYDQPGRMTQLFYPSTPGVPFVTNTYDSLSRVQAQTNILGGVWQYFLAGTRSEEVDPFGMRHVIYTTRTGKTRLDIQDWQGPKQTVTTTAYDALDRVTQTKAPEGNATSYTYDLASNVLTVTQTPKPGSPLSPLVTTTTYDPTFNKPLTITDPRGLVTTNTYDPWTGNLLKTVADSTGLKATTRYTYNGVGLPLTITDPVGTVTANGYDSSGNLVSVVRDAGAGRLNITTTSTFDARGDPLTVTDPRGNVTTNTWDAGRRLLTTTTPAVSSSPQGLKTTYTYDPAGKVLQTQQSSAGAVLRTTSATYTASGKPATTTDANGNVTRFAYDLLDRRTKVTDPMGRITTYVYDPLSRLVSASNPAITTGPLAQQAFTLNGQRASLVDANGNATSYTYDGLDRLSTTSWPGGSYETLGYDAGGNVVSRGTRAGQPIAYAYDGLNRLVTKTPPSPWPVVSYGYDLAGRVTSVSDTSAAIPLIATPGSTTAYTTTTAYDVLNRPMGVSWNPAPAATASAAGPVVTFGHSYNKANQRTAETVSDNTWLAYPSGTPSTTGYTANTLNQYTAVGAVTPTYDGNGNLTFDGTTTLGHDPENRLVSASGGGNTATYAFDPRGRRKVRTVNGTTTVTITGADNRELMDYDGATGAILRWYAYGPGPNAVLNQMNVASGTRDTLLPDLLGSIVASVDSSTGNIAPFGYRPYGTTSAAPAQFGYTGQRVDQETGLYYYRARHYSPAWGRFTQADPIGYQGGINLYGYVGNDPLNATDPSGLDTYFGQLTAAYVPIIGAVVSGGIYVTSRNSYGLPDIGFFGAAGPAVGVNTGVGAALGYQAGPLSSFQGRSINVDVSVGPLAASASYAPSGASTFSTLQGGTLGVSAGLPAVASATLSSPTTRTAGVMENMFIPFLQQLGIGPFSQQQVGASNGLPGIGSVPAATAASWLDPRAPGSGFGSYGGSGFANGFNLYPSYSK